MLQACHNAYDFVYSCKIDPSFFFKIPTIQDLDHRFSFDPYFLTKVTSGENIAIVSQTTFTPNASLIQFGLVN